MAASSGPAVVSSTDIVSALRLYKEPRPAGSYPHLYPPPSVVPPWQMTSPGIIAPIGLARAILRSLACAVVALARPRGRSARHKIKINVGEVRI